MMFKTNCWAAAFVAALGSNAEEGLNCLRAMAGPVKAISPAVFGAVHVRQIEMIVRDSVRTCGCVSGTDTVCVTDTACEYVIRFMLLLLEKKHFRHIDLIMREIETVIDKRDNVLAVTVESAAPLDAGFEQALRQCLLRHSGADAIKIKQQIVLQLLGGYKLRMGGQYIDASVQGQIAQMIADLKEVHRIAVYSI